MRDDPQTADGSPPATPPVTTRSRPELVLVVALVTAVMSAGVCVASVLARPPAVALPLVVIVCVGCPVFAAWELPGAVAALRGDRARRAGRRAMASLRRNLASLPETEHPLGL